jgi:hypothetical protein
VPQKAAFLETANRNDSRVWRAVLGRNESSHGQDFGVGGIFAASRNTGSGGLRPSASPPSRCWSGTDYYVCWVEGFDGDGSGVVPASLKAGTSHGQPILIVGVHFKPDRKERDGQVEQLGIRIRDLIQAQPGLANSQANPQAGWYNNRVVILGDWNVRAHRGGEHYEVLGVMRRWF